MKPTVYVGFAGGGLADIGFKAAGFEICGAIEIEPAIAEVYRANHGDHITVGDICKVVWKRVEKPDHFHVSPSCKNASQANSKGRETAQDIEVAMAICRGLRVLKPKSFSLENVPLYRNFKSFHMIVRTLADLGYWYRTQVFNMADWGVPQTRVRLILRATREGSGQGSIFGGGELPELRHSEPWNGWYGAIEDLVDGLPESQFAPWQLERMGELTDSSLVDCMNASREATIRSSSLPAMTVCSNQSKNWQKAFLFSDQSAREVKPSRADWEPATTVMAKSGSYSPAPIRAILASGTANDYGSSMTLRVDGEPSFTVNAQCGGRWNVRALLEHGRVVRMTPHPLARFQSVPGTYQLPEGNAKFLDGKKHHLAATIIGNGVPPLFMEKFAKAHCGGLF